MIENLGQRKRGVRKGDVRYLIQIVNEPHRIVVLKIRDTSLILLPIEYVGELVGKPGRRLVKEVERLQGWGARRIHEGSLAETEGEGKWRGTRGQDEGIYVPKPHPIHAAGDR